MPRMMDELLEKLRKTKEEILKMGGPEAIAKQHSRGKMTARERIDRFYDKGTFVELGMFVTSQIKDFEMKDRRTPADGVIIGYGDVNGRKVCTYSTDFTILAGSAGESHSRKIANIIELAGRMQVPVVGMLDSAGARLHEASALSRPFNAIFLNQSKYSGSIPQIQILMGPCAAGQGYSPMLSDFLIMTRGRSWMWLGGPRLTRAATSEDISDEDIGGADFHMQLSGQCDIVASDDEEALGKAKMLLSYCPQNWREAPEISPNDDPWDRADEELRYILPDDRRETYDMHEIIERIVDKATFFELKDEYAKNIITGFCRLGGRVVGIVGNNPEELAGVLENDSSDKYMRFMTFCDAFNIPILTIMDTPAFVLGRDWEAKGILRHGAKLLYGYATATVPKISLIVRRAYGGGNVVMGSKTMEADFSFVWPTAEISIMGPQSAAAIIWSKELEKYKDPKEYERVMREKMQEYHNAYIDPFFLAKNLRYDFIDDIIDPKETRPILIKAFEMAATKRVSMPEKKHGNPPQ